MMLDRVGDLSFIHEVEAAAARCSASQRREMLRRVTDLFIVGAAQYSEDQVALFDDVITRLALEIELSARALLAARLAPVPQAPPGIIRSLAFDEEIDVAGPVLALSERLDDPTLVENASRMSQEHLIAISQRHSLSEPVTDVLVERGDRQVVLTAVANRGARFSDAGFEVLVRRSDGDDDLAERVAARSEIPRPLLSTLLLKASQRVRAKLEAEHPLAKREVRWAVSTVTSRLQEARLQESGLQESRLEEEGALPDDEASRPRPRDGGEPEALTKDGGLAEATAALARACGLSRRFVEHAMAESRAETVLVLARAARLSWPAVKAILSMRAGIRGQSEAEVARALATFERITSATADQIVEFYRKRELPAPPASLRQPA